MGSRRIPESGRGGPGMERAGKTPDTMGSTPWNGRRPNCSWGLGVNGRPSRPRPTERVVCAMEKRNTRSEKSDALRGQRPEAKDAWMDAHCKSLPDHEAVPGVTGVSERRQSLGAHAGSSGPAPRGPLSPHSTNIYRP